MEDGDVYEVRVDYDNLYSSNHGFKKAEKYFLKIFLGGASTLKDRKKGLGRLLGIKHNNAMHAKSA